MFESGAIRQEGEPGVTEPIAFDRHTLVLMPAGRLAVEVASWLVPAGMPAFDRVRVPRSTADV